VRLVQPWPEGYSINAGSPYGWRVHPITRKKKFHHGVDVALPIGTVLTAPAAGEIFHHGSGASGGFTLIVRHADDLFTVYYHLAKSSHLPKGTKVKRGDPIALSGNSGASTGPHLHWEVRRSRKWGDTVDPVGYLGREELVEEPPVEEPTIREPVKEIEVEDPNPIRQSVEKPVPRPIKPRPMSAQLRRFFQIRRWLR